MAKANTEIKDCLAGNTALHVLAACDKLINEKGEKEKGAQSNGSSVLGTSKDSEKDCCASSENKNSTLSGERQIADKEVRHRAKLIDLMLPFATNCKLMPNRNGNLPWQLA